CVDGGTARVHADGRGSAGREVPYVPCQRVEEAQRRRHRVRTLPARPPLLARDPYAVDGHPRRNTLMALALDAPFAAPKSESRVRVGALAVPALASLGAGAIHAAAIGVHSEHRQAVFTFAIVAAIQLGLGAFALVSNRRLLGAALLLTNLAFVAGWVIAKSSGIGF